MKKARVDMNSVELEQLKNDVETKVGTLSIAAKRGRIKDDSAYELIELYEEYEKEGTTMQELRLLYDDLKLALIEM